ncbi:MAG: type II toxin-antitoxin system Phd/YefM family antitoxin [Candidatus Omnitrophica bacterium]|nr:type II toxin-antitoxin system Phd/YefM family antitoxin [Candidatus Omnitrophota bacterium]
MKFVTIRDLRSKSRQIQNDLPKYKEMILTSNGKPIAIMSVITEESLEDSLSAIRRARAISAVTGLQLQSAKSGRYMMPANEIETEIGEVRRRRAKR